MNGLPPTTSIHTATCTHPHHPAQRKAGIEALIRHVTQWHSQAAIVSCAVDFLSLTLHMRTIPHPMSGGTLAAAGNNPLNKRILSAPADSELCFCMPQIFAAYKNTARYRQAPIESAYSADYSRRRPACRRSSDAVSFSCAMLGIKNQLHKRRLRPGSAIE